ncbi:uncharacterized protein K452DRAFT_312365 [Aplosporella prunicola CBS 121167]|uniref:Uncharacterized protein n=1 Tax=Aplosporella prunicola CBS 121167 TaxID=1176127 RepID=A0A6A6AZI7_9PEZI|nr:uncharacterized protein K452DRAFT_312365 [Aplosporella prunicola CBS 121167]KAF2137352.1 hypothetical protein K452DRAFT_312365 [Aplosporella prunicola CBS 121167]
MAKERLRRLYSAMPSSAENYSLQELVRPKFFSIASSRSSIQNTETPTENIFGAPSYDENDVESSATFVPPDRTKNQTQLNFSLENGSRNTTLPAEKPYSERRIDERLVAEETRRNSILEFNGTASLFDARVICVRPNFTDWDITENGDHESSFFQGNIVAPTLPSDLAEILHFNMSTNGTLTKIPFHCSMEQFSYLQEGRSFRICLPGMSTTKTVFGGLTNALDPTVNRSTARSQYLNERDLFTAGNGNNSWRVEYGRMILFLDVEQHGPQATDYNGFAELNDDLIASGRDAWLDITSAGNPTAGRVSVTTCYDAFYQQAFASRLTHIQEFNINAIRTSNHTEPQAIWDPKNRKFDTTQLRKQLNALKTPLHRGQRGVFNLRLFL